MAEIEKKMPYLNKGLLLKTFEPLILTRIENFLLHTVMFDAQFHDHLQNLPSLVDMQLKITKQLQAMNHCQDMILFSFLAT